MEKNRLRNSRDGTLCKQLTLVTPNPTAQLLQRPAELSDRGRVLVALSSVN